MAADLALNNRSTVPAPMSDALELQTRYAIARAAEWLKGGAWPKGISRRSFDLTDLRNRAAWLRAQLEGCGAEIALGLIEALSIRYYSPDYTREEAKIIARQNIEDFSDIPGDILAAACMTYRRDPGSKFMAKPGQLLALCEPLLKRRRDDLADIERVIAAIDGPAQIAAPVPEPVEASAFGDLAKRLREVDKRHAADL